MHFLWLETPRGSKSSLERAENKVDKKIELKSRLFDLGKSFPHSSKMLSRIAVQAGRVTGRRGFSSVRSGVQKVKDLQQAYQQDPHLHGADDPTWLRAGAKDKAVFAGIAGLTVFAVLNVINGVKNMAFGINQIE